MVKRLFDITFAVCLLVLTFPLVAAGALAVFLVSPGPVLYRARRVGLHGQTFTMFKLRTMYSDRTDSGGAITAKQDTRVFPVGRLLRCSRIDELPQLFNVLRGDMSFVGPRPRDPAIVQHYTPLHKEILGVPPGLTSPGTLYYLLHGEKLLNIGDAVAGYVTDILPVKLALDLVYAREASLGYDLRLLLRTAWVMLKLSREESLDPELDRAQAFLQPVADPSHGSPQSMAV